ncbi:asparaginase [Pelagibius litoralis]|uniref:Asparaginase n=1 Tax=Pelagibius litoralis TaxID=374515 RepID=A0A967EX79_9PROT|nr:asparaginase [Pelagibius litoralis]NIA68150.1 asparaginase [Pelagibius litoralis]
MTLESLPSDRDAASEPGAAPPANPLLVEVTRGAMVESGHRAAIALVDAGGSVVLSAGDIERPVYARSAIKSLQAIAMVESGAAEAYDVSTAELSMACASHSGEARHAETAEAWLARIGCSVADLECGPQLPSHEPSMIALLAAGKLPTAAHNNCSGKHSGFLTLARHLGVPAKGYVKYEHPVQQRILGVLEGMTGLDLGAAPRGVDGCGIPVIGMPLGNIALAMARLGAPDDQPETRQAACARIRAAVAQEPFMVAGSGRFDTLVMEKTGAKALIKTGAEGVYCASFPELGLGAAIKVDDGAGRAAEVLMGRLLCHLDILSEDDAAALGGVLTPLIHNRAGLAVGELRPAERIPF